MVVVPVRSGDASSSGRIDPETENEKLDVPSPLASAPSTGLFVVIENEVVPSPLIEAVRIGVLVVTAMLAEPEPDEISCPSASSTEIVIVAEPVRSGDVSSSGKIIGVFVSTRIAALPTIGYPIRPSAVAVSEKSAVRRADISPPFCGINVEYGGELPYGRANCLFAAVVIETYCMFLAAPFDPKLLRLPTSTDVVDPPKRRSGFRLRVE